MPIEIDLNDDYEIIKRTLTFPQVMKDKLIKKLYEEIDSLQDTFDADGFEQDKKELELMRLRLKEIESIELNNL